MIYRIIFTCCLFIFHDEGIAAECKTVQECQSGSCRYVTICGSSNQISDPQLIKKLEDIERDRQQITEERRRLDAEKRQREQARVNQRINLQVSYTDPNLDGSFYINIQTNTDTASLRINGSEEGGRADGQYSIKRIARAGQASTFKIDVIDVLGMLTLRLLSFLGKQLIPSLVQQLFLPRLSKANLSEIRLP